MVNVREALSEPGEWYLDRPSGRLTYVPKPGEDPQQTVVVAPRLRYLVLSPAMSPNDVGSSTSSCAA